MPTQQSIIALAAGYLRIFQYITTQKVPVDDHLVSDLTVAFDQTSPDPTVVERAISRIEAMTAVEALQFQSTPDYSVDFRPFMADAAKRLSAFRGGRDYPTSQERAVAFWSADLLGAILLAGTTTEMAQSFAQMCLLNTGDFICWADNPKLQPFEFRQADLMLTLAAQFAGGAPLAKEIVVYAVDNIPAKA